MPQNLSASGNTLYRETSLPQGIKDESELRVRMFHIFGTYFYVLKFLRGVFTLRFLLLLWGEESYIFLIDNCVKIETFRLLPKTST